MTLSERSRILSATPMFYEQWGIDTRYGNYVNGPSHTDYTIYERQFTSSEGHAWPRDRGVRDAGGPFSTVRTRYWNSHPGEVCLYEPFNWPFQWHYEGSIIPYIGTIPAVFSDLGKGRADFEAFADGNSIHTNLVTLGTKFIAQTIPTNPVVDGSVSLAELFREGIPKMIGSTLLKDRIGFFRSLGSEYLNIEFGWKPLVNDLRDASRAIFESYEILKRLEEYSGRELNRFRVLPPTTTVSISSNAVTYPSGMPGSGWTSPPQYTIADTIVRQQWFSGQYLYYFDPGSMSDLERIVVEARLLYGLELSPEVVWNLAPWSWLVDWFANVGPLLSNVSAFQQDGLVLRYGYVMEQVDRDMRRTSVLGTPRSGNPHPPVVSDSFSSTWKRREKATPYGFGVASSTFTTRQWAILGALGITRAPKTL